MGVGFEVSKNSLHSRCALCLLLLTQDVSSQLFLELCLHYAIMDF